MNPILQSRGIRSGGLMMVDYYLSLNKPTFSSPTGDINLARVHEHALEVGLQYSF